MLAACVCVGEGTFVETAAVYLCCAQIDYRNSLKSQT